VLTETACPRRGHGRRRHRPGEGTPRRHAPSSCRQHSSFAGPWPCSSSASLCGFDWSATDSICLARCSI
jgi:hypothetical protein